MPREYRTKIQYKKTSKKLDYEEFMSQLQIYQMELKEMLELALQWSCQQWPSVEIKYQISNDPVIEEFNLKESMTNPIAFLGSNFRIVAGDALIYILSAKYLIDPTYCHQIIDLHPPYFPKVQKEGFRLRSERTVMFAQTMDLALNNGQIIPMLTTVEEVRQCFWDYLILQGGCTFFPEELNSVIIDGSKKIKMVNATIANALIDACHIFQKQLSIRPKRSKKDIIDDVINLSYTQLEYTILKVDRTCFPNEINNSGRFMKNFTVLVKNILQLFFKSQEATIDVLIENQFTVEDLPFALESHIENQLGNIAAHMHEFALRECADFIILFEAIKDVLFQICFDIETFILNTIDFVHKQMRLVDQLFTDFPVLGNIHTFQSIQTDVSIHIFQQLEKQHLEDEADFWRPEYQQLGIAQKFIKNILLYYLEYGQRKLNKPQKTANFRDCLLRAGIEPQEPLSLYQISYFDRNYIKENPFVKRYCQRRNHEVIGWEFQLESDEQILLYMHNNRLTLSLHWNQDQWDVEGSYIDQQGNLLTMAQEILKSDVYFVNQFELLQSARITQQYVQSSIMNLGYCIDVEEQLRRMKLEFVQQVSQAQRAGGGGLEVQTIAAGAIGSGLGILIVDCLDENIPWHKKLQRAGMGTAETTVMATISAQLPFVGFILAQTFLFYSVHTVINNPVVATQDKVAQIGHLGMKTSMGMGSALAGQLLIPIPVLGALIGSIVGGVAVGLYHKFVIPSTKTSLLTMIKKMGNYIQTESRIAGIITYDEEHLNNMRISTEHFLKHKPQTLTQSQWLTLILVNLVNEVQYIFDLSCQEKRKQLISKSPLPIEKIHNLNVAQDEMDKHFVKWEASRYYLTKNKLSTLKYACEVGFFVDGMIKNFKI